MEAKKKLAILTNVVAPSRVPIFESLSATFDTLILSGSDEANRSWDVKPSARLRIEKVRGFQFRATKKTGIGGVKDTIYLHFSFGLFWRLPQFNPDIILTNEMGFRTVIAILYGWLARVPVWVWSGGTLHSERFASKSRSILRPFFAKFVRRWVSYGDAATEYLLTLGVKRSAILQIQNCIAQERFLTYSGGVEPALANCKQPVLLAVGQMISRKGLDRLIESAARLAKQGRTFTLVLVGKGVEEESLKQRAADAGLVDVIFLPEQDQAQLNGLYHQADALVFPTFEDIWGLVVNEALWAGLPVLCSCYAGCAFELLPPENIFDPTAPTAFDAALSLAIEGKLKPADRSRLKTWQEVAGLLLHSLATSRTRSQVADQSKHSSDLSSPRTRVCVISHAYVEQGNLPILTSIAQSPGVELALITPDKYFVDLHHSSGVFSPVEPLYKTYAVPILLGSRQGTFFYKMAALQAALDDFKPDIILHEQEVFSFGAVQIASIARRRSIPLVMQVAENIDRSLALPRQWMRDYVMKRCDGLLCWSVGSATVHSEWGFNKKIAVIPGMAVISLNQNCTFGRRNEGFLQVCFAGRLIHSKGVDCLLSAIALLRDEGVQVRCLIAGHGPSLGELEAQTKELHLQEVVTFLGVLSTEKVLDLLCHSDVLVLPSRVTPVWKEQFGRVLVQAMAEGTVTVGSRTGAIPDVIGYEDLLFDKENCRELANILKRLALDDDLFQKRQRDLWKRAESTFLNSSLAARKVQFLREIIATA